MTWADDDPSEASSDVHSARRTQEGVVLDPGGFFLAVLTNPTSNPVAASDGRNYLVVWEDGRGGTVDLYAARVTPRGKVLDGTGISIAVSDEEDEDAAVVWDGSNYLVVWSQNILHGAKNIVGVRVSPDGIVLDGVPIQISNAPLDQTSPALAYNGTEVLVVWKDERSFGLDVYGARVTPDGQVLDPAGIPISRGPQEEDQPGVASDGDQFLVVWEDGRSGNQRHAFGARLTADGEVLDPNGIAISLAASIVAALW